MGAWWITWRRRGAEVREASTTKGRKEKKKPRSNPEGYTPSRAWRTEYGERRPGRQVSPGHGHRHQVNGTRTDPWRLITSSSGAREAELLVSIMHACCTCILVPGICHHPVLLSTPQRNVKTRRIRKRFLRKCT